MPDRKTVLGIALGVGATLAAPFAAPVVGAAARPLVKAFVKQSLLMYETLRERFATAGEGLDDLVAEVRAEVEEELAQKGPPIRKRPDARSSNGSSSEGNGARSRVPS